MGLDGVAIVMEVEDRFGIDIPEDAIAGMETVGDMFDYVVAALEPPATESGCLSARAFLSLRQAAEALGSHERLRPRDSIEAILPRTGRIEYWLRLQTKSGLTLPPLRVAEWLVLTCTLLVVICTLVAGLATYTSTRSQITAYLAGLSTAAFAAVVAVNATRPFATSPPPECGTLRRLANTALRLNFQTLSERGGSRGRDDVWIALREIIVHQLDVSPEEVIPSARFVQDLGAG